MPPAVDLHDLTDGGERVTHLHPNDCYFAHLSIYAFARQFAAGGTVLDAGCGTGYGAAYLAAHGARHVTAVDGSPKAVAFCRRTFVRANLDYRALDLEQPAGLPERHFDLVFSSNVLEHLADVRPFLSAAWRAVKPGGTLLVAVPPITSDGHRADNLANPYHLNIWSPRQWRHVLARYFGDVTYHGHRAGHGVRLDFGAAPQGTSVTEADFEFPPVPAAEMDTFETLTAVFVARRPLPADGVPGGHEPLTFVDDSFTRPPAPRPTSRPLALRAWDVVRRRGLRSAVARVFRRAAG